VNSELFGVGGEFTEGNNTGITTSGFDPRWYQVPSIKSYSYRVFGPWLRDQSGWSITFSSLGTNHFAIKLRVALYQTSAYKGTFEVNVLREKYNFTYGPSSPPMDYTLNEQGKEWGFLK